MTQRTTPPLPFAAPASRSTAVSPLPFVAPVPAAATAASHTPSPSRKPRAAAPVQPSLFADPPELQEATVLVASIRPNPHLRSRDIIESVGKIGVTQPILITPIDDPQYLYGVVAGGRRLHSALHFKLDTIRVNVTGGSAAQLAMLRAVENGARSANPVAEARAYQEAMNAGVYASEKALAKDMGLDVQLVVKRLRLAGLPDDILAAVDEGRLSCPNAERIVQLKGEYRDRAFADVRAALSEGRKFTGDDLKNVKTRQKGDMGTVLSGLLGALPASAMQPLLTLSPAQLLAEEFRAIAQERGVNLDEVVALLAGGVTSPAHAQPVPVATSVDLGRDTSAAPSQPAPTPPAPTRSAPPFAAPEAAPAAVQAAPNPAPQRRAMPFAAPVSAPASAEAPPPEVPSETVAPAARSPLPFAPAVTATVAPAVTPEAPVAQTAEVAEPEPTEPLDDGYGVQTSALLMVSTPALVTGGLGLLGTDSPDEGVQEMPWPGFDGAPSEPEARGPSLDELEGDAGLGPEDPLPPVSPPHAPLQAQNAPDPLSADVAPATDADVQDMPAALGAQDEPAESAAQDTPAAWTTLLGVPAQDTLSAEAGREDELPWPADSGPDAVQAAHAEHAEALSAAQATQADPEYVPFIEKGDEEPDDDGTVLRRPRGRLNIHTALSAGRTAAPPARRTNLIPRR